MCKKYVNIQTKELLDLNRISTLKDNAMLKVKPELWVEWDFEKNDELGLDIWSVTKGSNKKVWWICLKCKSSYDSSIGKRTHQNRGCGFCNGNRVNHTNSLASLNPQLSSEWHPTKNGDLTPHDIRFKSNKKVWWLGECGHEWDAEVYSRNSGNGCPYCCHNPKVLKGVNDIYTVNKDKFKLLMNPEDGYRFTEFSNTKVEWKCSICKKSAGFKVIASVNKNNIYCNKCLPSSSIGERFVKKVLDHLGFKYEFDKTTDWSNNKRYDFYIPSLNCIIEVHGEQHYIDSFSSIGGRTAEEEYKNDKYKRELAISNGIVNYYEINASKPTADKIIEELSKCEVLEVSKLNNQELLSLYENSNKHILHEICEIWNTVGNNRTVKTAKFSGYDNTTVIKYLELGANLGIINYNKNSGLKKKINQYDLNGNLMRTWSSITEASKSLNTSDGNIHSCLTRKTKKARGFIWRYVDETN